MTACTPNHPRDVSGVGGKVFCVGGTIFCMDSKVFCTSDTA